MHLIIFYAENGRENHIPLHFLDLYLIHYAHLTIRSLHVTPIVLQLYSWCLCYSRYIQSIGINSHPYRSFLWEGFGARISYGRDLPFPGNSSVISLHRHLRQLQREITVVILSAQFISISSNPNRCISTSPVLEISRLKLAAKRSLIF